MVEEINFQLFKKYEKLCDKIINVQKIKEKVPQSQKNTKEGRLF